MNKEENIKMLEGPKEGEHPLHYIARELLETVNPLSKSNREIRKARKQREKEALEKSRARDRASRERFKNL